METLDNFNEFVLRANQALDNLKAAIEEIQNYFCCDNPHNYPFEDRRWAYWSLTDQGVMFAESKEKLLLSDEDLFTEEYAFQQNGGLWKQEAHTLVLTNTGAGGFNILGIYDNSKKV